METFEVACIDQTHDEMIRKIDEKAATAQARMEMALDNIDADGIAIEEEARKLEANELLKQFEMELGMTPAAPEGESEKTIGPSTEEETGKTMGPTKKQILE
jgi:phage shock protein A